MKPIPQVFVDRILRLDRALVVAEVDAHEPDRRAWVTLSKWPCRNDDGTSTAEFLVHRYELPIRYLKEDWETDDNPPPYEHDSRLLTTSFTEAAEAALNLAPRPEQWGMLIDHPDCPG